MCLGIELSIYQCITEPCEAQELVSYVDLTAAS